MGGDSYPAAAYRIAGRQNHAVVFSMTALEPPLRAAGFSRGLKAALALPGIATPRGLKPAARAVSGNLTRSY